MTGKRCVMIIFCMILIRLIVSGWVFAQAVESGETEEEARYDFIEIKLKSQEELVIASHLKVCESNGVHYYFVVKPDESFVKYEIDEVEYFTNVTLNTEEGNEVTDAVDEARKPPSSADAKLPDISTQAVDAPKDTQQNAGSIRKVTTARGYEAVAQIEPLNINTDYMTEKDMKRNKSQLESYNRHQSSGRSRSGGSGSRSESRMTFRYTYDAMGRCIRTSVDF